MIKVLEGDNPFLSKERLNSLVQELQTEKPQAMVKIIEAGNMDASEIIREYQTQDIFSPEKILVIKRLMLNKQYKEIVECINDDSTPAKSIDLIIWEEQKIPKNTRYYKLFNNKKYIESFSAFNRRTFPNWAKTKLSNSNLKATPQVLEDLMIMTNYDPYAFNNEINKFNLLDIDEITVKHLENYITTIHDYDIWKFLDATNQDDNKGEIIKILERLFEKRIQAPYLIIMIARNLKQIMIVIKLLKAGINDKEIISILKIPPFTLPRLKSIANQSDYSKLLTIYEKIYRLDYEIKTGNIEGELGLILLTTRL